MDFLIALHALALLLHEGTRLSSGTIAKSIGCHAVQVRRVLGKCKAAGLITCATGVKGGYALREGESITLLEVLLALELQLFNPKCETFPKTECVVTRGMHPVLVALHEGINASLHQYLAKLTINDIDKALHDVEAGQRVDLNDRFGFDCALVPNLLVRQHQARHLG